MQLDKIMSKCITIFYNIWTSLNYYTYTFTYLITLHAVSTGTSQTTEHPLPYQGLRGHSKEYFIERRGKTLRLYTNYYKKNIE